MPAIHLNGVSAGTSVSVTDSTQATFTVLSAPTGTSPIPYKLSRIILNNLSADNLTVKLGSTVLIGPLYFAANGGLVLEYTPKYVVQMGGNDLTVTKGAASNTVTAYVEYQ